MKADPQTSDSSTWGWSGHSLMWSAEKAAVLEEEDYDLCFDKLSLMCYGQLRC